MTCPHDSPKERPPLGLRLSFEHADADGDALGYVIIEQRPVDIAARHSLEVERVFRLDGGSIA